ncbi:MAG: tRNA (N6-isopentenyl adenosine(37)-C2)-methylthiotransferase MiaB [Synergistaceae bacterium]|nr:tRNA (N6-isopentenyl adenosine(37)-C2)-methylthiotransferase MiaB [Synergistaceae bacterium]
MINFMMKVYGCQMNVYDSDKLRTALLNRGWTECSDEEKSDVVIFTGCSVRDKAEQKVWSELGRYSSSWEKGRRPVVAVTGCIAQNIGKKMLPRYPWVRLVSGPRHIGLVPDGIESALSSAASGAKGKVILLDEDPRAFTDIKLGETPYSRLNRWRAFITIAHGCDNFCSYCIVPYVRGRFLSRQRDEIIKEARMLAGDGVAEITLLGQNVNSYPGFSDLLRDVAGITGIKLVRFVTSLPQDFSDDIIEAMAEEPKICPSINLPIQAGSNEVLKRMNRKYTREEYFRLVDKIRARLPEVGITSDLIVGFPGESEQDFELSVDALRRVRFDQVHTAAYSIREGTAAAGFPDQLPLEVRMERLNRVNAVQNEISLEINKKLTGKEYSILLDGPAPKGEGLIQGRTPTDKVVLIEGDGSLLGSFAHVRITGAENWCLSGEIIKT